MVFQKPGTTAAGPPASLRLIWKKGKAETGAKENLKRLKMVPDGSVVGKDVFVVLKEAEDYDEWHIYNII